MNDNTASGDERAASTTQSLRALDENEDADVRKLMAMRAGCLAVAEQAADELHAQRSRLKKRLRALNENNAHLASCLDSAVAQLLLPDETGARRKWAMDDFRSTQPNSSLTCVEQSADAAYAAAQDIMRSLESIRASVARTREVGRLLGKKTEEETSKLAPRELISDAAPSSAHN